jgi:transposase-like protein
MRSLLQWDLALLKNCYWLKPETMNEKLTAILGELRSCLENLDCASGKRGMILYRGRKLLLSYEAMPCPLCGHDQTYKHGKTSKGSQRYRCPNCKQTFTNTCDTIYYRRQVSEEEVRIVLQSHCEGTSLRGMSRISGLSYNTGVSLIRAASQKAQLVHNAEVQAVDTDAIAGDELWSFVEKNNGNACQKNLKSEIVG